MRQLIKELRYHFRLHYQVKAIAFAKAPARVKNTLLVLQSLYLAAVLTIIGNAVFGPLGSIGGAMTGAVVGYIYTRMLEIDGREAMRQVALLERRDRQRD